ncbi:MAG: hypothetical protein J0I98_18550 [Mesorhizobium sp.]|nr:hypothetical protein [Mesorhizobium sp.]MBN9244789.1 hypothetical protein [Mesorhizobium sp.]
MSIRTICATSLLAMALATPSFAGAVRHHTVPPGEERYVPAHEDPLNWFFGGPRYYDQRMITTAAGQCAYQRVGPDGNAVNDVNDHYCGK